MEPGRKIPFDNFAIISWQWILRAHMHIHTLLCVFMLVYIAVIYIYIHIHEFIRHTRLSKCIRTVPGYEDLSIAMHSALYYCTTLGMKNPTTCFTFSSQITSGPGP